MRCNACNYDLLKTVEDGGVLMRGKAPRYAVRRGRLIIKQKCPRCNREYEYAPLFIQVGVTPEKGGSLETASQPS